MIDSDLEALKDEHVMLLTPVQVILRWDFGPPWSSVGGEMVLPFEARAEPWKGYA